MCIKPIPMSFAIGALLLASVLALVTPAAVSAATVTATTYTDRATGACATTGSGDCSLRETTIYANAHPGTTILIEPGTYFLSIPPNGSDDATTGDLNLTNDTTMTTPNGTLAVIDGGGQDRILNTGNGMTATTVTLYNLTFRREQQRRRAPEWRLPDAGELHRDGEPGSIGWRNLWWRHAHQQRGEQ